MAHQFNAGSNDPPGGRPPHPHMQPGVWQGFLPHGIRFPPGVIMVPFPPMVMMRPPSPGHHWSQVARADSPVFVTFTDQGVSVVSSPRGSPIAHNSAPPSMGPWSPLDRAASPPSVSGSPRGSPAPRRRCVELSQHRVRIFEEVKTAKNVRRLGENWRWMPSDHLPCGFQVSSELYVGSWNVLNRDLIDVWMNQQDTQGLRGSSITTQCALEMSASIVISSREKQVVAFIKDMLTHETCPKALVALQECGDSFLAFLKQELSNTPFMIVQEGENLGDQLAFIYDSRVLHIHSCKTEKIFTDPKKGVLNVLFQDLQYGERFRFVNVHLSGDPRCLNAREAFARHLAMCSHSDQPQMIALGDMNFTVQELEPMLTDEADRQGTHFQVFVPSYPTNIGIGKQIASQEELVYPAKKIDFVITSRSNPAARILEPSEVMGSDGAVAIEKTIQLIESFTVT